MSKPGKSLRTLCKKLGVRLTVKKGKKRVYKSVAVLKRQCAKKQKKKKVKRKRRFGMFSEIDYDKIKKFRDFKKLSMDRERRYIFKKNNTKLYPKDCKELEEIISIFDRIKDSRDISPVPTAMFSLYNQMC